MTLYLHELAHNLIDDAEREIEGRETIIHGHNAAFYSINACLLMRLDSSSD
jgi:hypothetical protein